MSRYRNPSAPAVLAVLAILVIGCAAPQQAGTGVPVRNSHGAVPVPVTDAAERVELTECTGLDAHRVRWTVTVTNPTDRTRLFRGGAVSITTAGGGIFAGEGTGWLGNLGPGRRFVPSAVSERFDRDAGTDPVCALRADPLDEEYKPVTVGTPVADADVELVGCGGGSSGTGSIGTGAGDLRIRNSSDRPAALYATVEYFAPDGRSLGQEKVEHQPETGSGIVPAVAPGAMHEFTLEGPVHQQVAAGEELSCTVVAARMELDPEPLEVIYD